MLEVRMRAAIPPPRWEGYLTRYVTYVPLDLFRKGCMDVPESVACTSESV